MIMLTLTYRPAYAHGPSAQLKIRVTGDNKFRQHNARTEFLMTSEQQQQKLVGQSIIMIKQFNIC